MDTESSQTLSSYSRKSIVVFTLALLGVAPVATAQDRSGASVGSVTRTDRSSGGPIVVDVDRDTGSSRDRNQDSSDRARAEKERQEQAARERAEKERQEQAARERAEKAAAEKAARERAEKAAAEKAARERAERERQEQIARDRAERERQEQIARERAEKAAAEKAARERAEKAAAEKAAAEKAARERAEKAAAEKAAAEKAARERAEKAAAEKAAREREEKEREDKEREDKDDDNWTDLSIGRVSASGDGCPAGSWRAQIDATGHGFSVEFTRLSATITPNQTEAAVRCRLAIAVPAKSAGMSYRVGQFAYSGYTYLEKGVLAEFTTDYAFANDPSTAFKVRTELAGPLDREYTVTDDVGKEALWSPCSTANTFNVDVTVRLKHGETRADGTIEVGGANGLAFELRTCD